MLKTEFIQYKPWKYFFITFITTWGFWLSAKLCITNQGPELISILFALFGLFTPFVTALYLIFSSKNKNLKNLFLNKLLNIRLIKFDNVVPILLIPPISIILAIVISTFFGYSFDQFTLAKSFSFNIGIMPTFLLLILAASLEELGWRGYAMESIASKFNYFQATVIFSVLWALWHLPLFFLDHTYQSNILNVNVIYAINFMVSIIPLAFIISWICKKNNNSILAAIFLHFIINISQEAFQVQNDTKCIQTIVLIVFAAIIVYTNKEMFFYDK